MLQGTTTAAAVSQKIFPSAGQANSVVLVSGANFVDAVPAGVLAKQTNGSILLTAKNFIPATTFAEIQRILPNSPSSTIYIVGGTAVIEPSVENWLRNNLNVNVVRIGVTNRFDTSVQIANRLGTKLHGLHCQHEPY